MKETSRQGFQGSYNTFEEEQEWESKSKQQTTPRWDVLPYGSVGDLKEEK